MNRLSTLGLCALLAAGVTAQKQIYTFYGSHGGGRQGFAVAGIGDVNGDGHGEVLVGSTRAQGTGQVEVLSGYDGRSLAVLRGASRGSDFGWAVAGLGDVDGDRVPDFVVGAPFESSFAGVARVYSGKDFRVLYTLRGGSREVFGVSVNSAGDVDRDGRPDVIVGGHGGSKHGSNTGLARVYSGRTGRLIRRFDGDSYRDFFGHSVAGAGDVDRDGHADLIVGVPDDDDGGNNAGSARVYSGRTGKILFRWDANRATDNFGHSVANAGDVNRDGFTDLIVGAPQFTKTSLGTGYARIFSGKDGKTLRTIRGDGLGDYFGEPVAAAGDWNGDGYGDVVIGAYKNDRSGPDAGLVRVYSGRTGVVLAEFRGWNDGAHFGYAARMAGDVNGDRVPDLVIGAPQASGRGLVQVVSSRDQTLYTDLHAVSVARGGSQTFRLNVPGGGLRPYLLLGSMSGKSPGILFGQRVMLPLRADGYTLLTAALPNTWIMPSLSILDRDGRGSATLRIPAASHALRGLVLHHAFLVLDSATRAALFASNAVPLRLDK